VYISLSLSLYIYIFLLLFTCNIYVYVIFESVFKCTRPLLKSVHSHARVRAYTHNLSYCVFCSLPVGLSLSALSCSACLSLSALSLFLSPSLFHFTHKLSLSLRFSLSFYLPFFLSLFLSLFLSHTHTHTHTHTRNRGRSSRAGRLGRLIFY